MHHKRNKNRKNSCSYSCANDGYPVDTISKSSYGETDDKYRKDPFSGCPNLEEILVSSENEFFVSKDGVLFSPIKYRVDAGYTDDLSLIAYPASKPSKSYIISERVYQILPRAFENCKYLEEVSLPLNVRRIEAFAFSGCKNLERVSNPGSNTGINIDYIGDYAFSNCTSLTTLDISANAKFGKDILSGTEQKSPTAAADLILEISSEQMNSIAAKAVQDLNTASQIGQQRRRDWTPEGGEIRHLRRQGWTQKNRSVVRLVLRPHEGE